MSRDLFEVRGSRRAALGGALGLAGVAMLGRTAGAQDATPEAGWTYTDVLGNVIELPEQPQRIAAVIQSAAALWDFGVEPAAVFGGRQDRVSGRWLRWRTQRLRKARHDTRRRNACTAPNQKFSFRFS